jgi:hypothetical protein
LTYITNLDAKTAIWVTSQQRPEHTRAIQWLNEATSEDISFFLVKVEAVRIDDSLPAPRFTVIVGPSIEGKAVGREKKSWQVRRQRMRNSGGSYWSVLRLRALRRTRGVLDRRIIGCRQGPA